MVQIWKASLYLVLTYRPDKLTSQKWGKFWLSSPISPWRSPSITPQNNRDLNQGLLHLWSKFGDPGLNGWWIIARTSSWLTDRHTHTHTHTHTQASTIPEGQNWPRVKSPRRFMVACMLNIWEANILCITVGMMYLRWAIWYGAQYEIIWRTVVQSLCNNVFGTSNVNGMNAVICDVF